MFSLALAVSATALLLTLGFAEHRRTFALIRALGGQPGQLGGFVWTEIGVTGLLGVGLGTIGGWVLTQMLVKVLSGVFDPPPSALAVPWGNLGIVALLAVAGLTTAAWVTIIAARRSPLSVLRDL